MSDNDRIGRLAMRQEGGNWNAYYASDENMEGAIFLGSINMASVVKNKEIKIRFMELMKICLCDAVEDAVGSQPMMGDPEVAPLHERAGNA